MSSILVVANPFDLVVSLNYFDYIRIVITATNPRNNMYFERYQLRGGDQP